MTLGIDQLPSQISRVGAVLRRSDSRILGTCVVEACGAAITVPHVLQDQRDVTDLTVLTTAGSYVVERATHENARPFVSLHFPDQRTLDELHSRECILGEPVYVVGWAQMSKQGPFSAVRTLRSSIIRERFEHDGMLLFEIQGQFPLGFSGAAIYSASFDLLGLLEGVGSLPLDEKDYPSFEFGIGVATSGQGR